MPVYELNASDLPSFVDQNVDENLTLNSEILGHCRQSRCDTVLRLFYESRRIEPNLFPHFVH